MRTWIRKLSWALAALMLIGLCPLPQQGARAEEPALSLYPGYVEIPVGFTVYLDCQTTPGNQAVVWSTSDKKVAKVDSKGGITGKAEGEATITVKLKDNKKVAASCGVRVSKDGSSVIVWQAPPPEDPPTPPKPDDPQNPPEPQKEIPVEIKPDEGQTEIHIEQIEMQKIIEKVGYVWSIVVNGTQNGSMNTKIPGVVDTYTLRFAATKDSAGGDIFGRYKGTGSLKYEAVGVEGIAKSQGHITELGVAMSGPLNEIEFELRKPPEPTPAPADALVPLEPLDTVKAKASPYMVWSMDMHAGATADNASTKKDTAVEQSIIYDIEVYSQGAVYLEIGGATADGSILRFRGTITKQIIWKRVK